MKLPSVTLKSGRERSLLNRHPWVFSGGVHTLPDCDDGSLVSVRAADGSVLGSGYLNRKSSIVVRMLRFDEGNPRDAVFENLERAVLMREQAHASWLDASVTNAYRLVNSEGDFVPGLIVDRYGDVLVFQISTLGIEVMRSEIVAWFKKRLAPRVIFEKSTSGARKEEGLDPREGVLDGDEPEKVTILENGHKFAVRFRDSQKTGFFLDQREMRVLIGDLAPGRSVLNCFSYTGGFSVYAAKAGARSVESVDVSSPAIDGAKENFELNGLSSEQHSFRAVDVFDRLRESEDLFDIVILDPPAFAKRRTHVQQACKGYSEINREGMKRVSPGGYLITSSCSHFVDDKLFQQVAFQAARDAGRSIRVVGHHRHAFDHPVSIFHPEGAYLKSLVLQVE
jgi:23S rRNA (cytosine1962-C5)-methyltransferase